MNLRVTEFNGLRIAVVHSNDTLISDVQTAMDLMVTVRYETGCDRIAITKSAVAGDFFILSTRLAGDVLQKFINYRVKFAIFGDFSRYTSKPLKDFIYESNRGKDFFFVPSEEEAVDRLSKV